MTKTQQVLLAAGKLAKGAESVNVFELTVKLWERHPDEWGLWGYKAKYPDHKAVTVAVQHLLGRKISRRLTPQLLERCGENRVRLTQEGWAVYHQLAAGAKKVVRPTFVDAGYVG